MKKLAILILLVLGINICHAQKELDKLWTELEKFELEGRFHSANRITNQILQEAKKSKQSDQIVKGFIYQSKFSLLLEEDAQKKVIQNLEIHLKESDTPTSALLESIYAQFLKQYLDENRYKIRKRTKLEGPVTALEFEKWDINTLGEQIVLHYKRSLQNKQALQNIPINEYRDILTESYSSHKFRPTLYDFLAHRAIQYYQKNTWYFTRPKEKFYISNPVVFKSTEEFSKELFLTKDSVFSNRNALLLYQQLELFHESSDTTAYVDVVLERLNFAKEQGNIENKEDLYIKELKRLSNRFAKHSASAMINYKIADYYFQESNLHYNTKYDPILKDHRIKALDICNSVVKQYPNSDGGLLCTILKNKIVQASVSLQTEQYNMPNKAFLAKVQFKSVDSLYLSAYRVPYDFYKNKSSYKKDSLLLNVLEKTKASASKFYLLQPKKDYYEYTTEVDVPALPAGNYILVSSGSKKISSIDEIYNHAVISISKLSMLSINRKKHELIKILDRETGAPKENVKISVSSEHENFERNGFTNSNGEFLIEKNNKNHHYQIIATDGTDTITNQSYINRFNKDSNKDKEHMAKGYLYLDRSIYRPGQTLYFKGILTEKKDGKSQVVPNTYVSISISDANYEELKEFRLKTNEYGSVSGEFTLPDNLLTGQFTIEMDEDLGTKIEDPDPFYDKIDDFDYIELNFSVEEYKRPKFEVVFDAIKNNYVIGDSVSATVFAKAFLGSNISNSKVSYTISRERMYDWRRGFYGSSSQIIKTGTCKTNAEGKFSIDFVAIPDSLAKKEDKPVFLYSIKADVTDQNGETRSSSKNIKVAYHNLKVDVVMGSQLNSNKDQTISVQTKNLNDQFIDANVELSIKKLNGPARVVRKKPWEIVEIHSIPKEQFIKDFPHEVYDSTDVEQNWPKGNTVYTKKAGPKESKEFTLPKLQKWEAGIYQLEVKATDSGKDTVITSKNFEVYHPDNKELADHQMFSYEMVNLDFKKDKYVILKLKTACQQLNVHAEAYYRNENVFKKLVSIENGYSIVKIPVKESYTNKLDFNLYFVKYNSIVREQFSAVFKEVENKLNIETLSFRNKLSPGQEESWSFKITNSNNKKAQAEVLASMYDTSLDQFKTHAWKKDIGFQKNYYSSAPYIQSRFFGLQYFSNFNSFRFTNTVPYLKKYHKLKQFGCHFGNTEYTNTIYLKHLKNKQNTIQYVEGNVNGIVTDETGMPIPGVRIMIKGTKTSVSTDFDGFYSINSPAGAELIFSFVGMDTQEMIVSKSGTYNLALQADNVACDEVVVTAMGIARETSTTGSYAYIKASDVRNDIFRQLQGQVAGIEILEEEEADMDEEVSYVKIRGYSGVGTSNAPLYIIDGIPVDAQTGAQFSPKDVADITVLKGASATALYGSRASNGVVIISTKKGLEELTQVETRSDLKETAFFYPHLWTNKKGEIIFKFNSPKALTKWRLMLFAHNKSTENGYVEKFVVTQKNLNVIPNVPRFLREGDTITLSAKISNLTKEKLQGSAALQLFDGTNGNPIDKNQVDFNPMLFFEVDAKGNTNLNWTIKVPKDLAALQYKIVAKAGSHSDGEMGIIPVLSNRTLVTEAKSIWVQPGTTKEIEFEKLKNGNSKTQSNHKYILEYTTNPAWLALKSLPYLMEFPHECAEQTFSRFYANALANDILKKNPKIKEVIQAWKKDQSLTSPLEKNKELKSILIAESPWVREAQSEEQNKARLANLFENDKLSQEQAQALSKLSEMQLSSGAFPWFAGGYENQFMTQHIVAGIGHLQKLNINNEYRNQSQKIEKKAIAYLDEKFMEQHQRWAELAKDTSNISLSSINLHYLYCRSFFNANYPLSNQLQEITKLYIEKCKKDWLTHSLYNKALIALILQRNGEEDAAKQITDALTEQAVIKEENGMYWKNNKSGWYWHQSAIECQALLIETFSEVDGDMNKVNRLQQWLLKKKQTNKWPSTKATTEAIYALLMHGNNSLALSDNTQITIGDKNLSSDKLEKVQKEAGTGYFKLNWKKEEIDSSMAKVKVSNQGKITGFGGVYWQYFEDLDKISDSDQGELQVQKSMYINKTTDEGEVLEPITAKTPVKVGDLISVRLVIESKNDLEFIHLKDLRAAGMEPLDVLSGYKWQDGLGYYQSTKDVASHFFFEVLPKGRYVFEYELRANNKGNFSNGNASIQSMYAPEFTGHSKGNRISIHESE
ncbi:MG2 domain-containing protein [Marinifilum fragile]|uniref:alpha-2-macroglobulin family protein n=1 Tax=Marinifilum fragile TaxID=570161 RepID=UPI002AA8AA22|nr:MG2 domain-containing protein [Marinifilum fragile]